MTSRPLNQIGTNPESAELNVTMILQSLLLRQMAVCGRPCGTIAVWPPRAMLMTSRELPSKRKVKRTRPSSTWKSSCERGCECSRKIFPLFRVKDVIWVWTSTPARAGKSAMLASYNRNWSLSMNLPFFGSIRNAESGSFARMLAAVCRPVLGIAPCVCVATSEAMSVNIGRVNMFVRLRLSLKYGIGTCNGLYWIVVRTVLEAGMRTACFYIPKRRETRTVLSGFTNRILMDQKHAAPSCDHNVIVRWLCIFVIL